MDTISERMGNGGSASRRSAPMKLFLVPIGIVLALVLSGLLPGLMNGGPEITGRSGIPGAPVPGADDDNSPQPAPAPSWKAYPYKDGAFSFPQDEGIHHDALEEWWYVNSHLVAQDGRRIDVMICFYKHGIIAASLFDESTGIYLNHTETYLDLSLASGHLSLQYGPNGLRQIDGRPFTYELSYRSRDFSVSLVLENMQKPLLASGDGIIRMGRGMSYYYSLTGLEASGLVLLGSERMSVSGSGWMDRQWGAWSPKLRWDWFSISLDNGMRVLAYRLFEQGTGQPIREYVSVMDVSGATFHFNRSADYCTIVFGYNGYWRSPQTGKLYSSGWGLSVPGFGLSLGLEPISVDQETLFPADERLAGQRMPFWEGTCRVSGEARGEPVSGLAFVETTYDYVYQEGDLVVTPKEYVQDGDGSKLVFMVENKGSNSLTDVELRLVLGSPLEGGKILRTYNLDSARRNYTYVSDNLPDLGSIPLYLVVDPDNHFAELGEQNNIAMAILK